MKEQKRFVVLSPKFEVTVPVLEYGEGPKEDSWLEMEVEACSKREAISVAVKTWRRKHGKCGLPYCESDENPYKGVTAVLWAECYGLAEEATDHG